MEEAYIYYSERNDDYIIARTIKECVDHAKESYSSSDYKWIAKADKDDLDATPFIPCYMFVSKTKNEKGNSMLMREKYPVKEAETVEPEPKISYHDNVSFLFKDGTVNHYFNIESVTHDDTYFIVNIKRNDQYQTTHIPLDKVLCKCEWRSDSDNESPIDQLPRFFKDTIERYHDKLEKKKLEEFHKKYKVGKYYKMQFPSVSDKFCIVKFLRYFGEGSWGARFENIYDHGMGFIKEPCVTMKNFLNLEVTEIPEGGQM